jgi:transposase
LATGLYSNGISFWVNEYKRHGFNGLLTNKYGTNKSELEKHSTTFLSCFEQQPPMTAAEAVERIFEMTGIQRSEQQARVFMKRHGLKFIKCGHIPSKANNEDQAK